MKSKKKTKEIKRQFFEKSDSIDKPHPNELMSKKMNMFIILLEDLGYAIIKEKIIRINMSEKK